MYERKTRSLCDDSVGEAPETFEIVSAKVTAGVGGGIWDGMWEDQGYLLNGSFLFVSVSCLLCVPYHRLSKPGHSS